jgi:hypothetical protein
MSRSVPAVLTALLAAAAAGCVPSPAARYASDMGRFTHQAREAHARWEKSDLSVPDIQKYAQVLRAYLLTPGDRADADSGALYAKALALVEAYEALSKHIEDRKAASDEWTKLKLARGPDDADVKASEAKLQDLGRQGPELAQAVRQKGGEYLAAYDELLKRLPPT